MNFNQDVARSWLDQTAMGLPGLPTILMQSTSEVLIIGAGVFDIYTGQGWTPQFKRKTGDLDLSVGLFSGESDYNILKKALLDEGYTASEQQKYRFFSPKKIPGGLTYVDLLAHPGEGKVSADFTKNVIGVGPHFSFEGFVFARLGAFQLNQRVFFPNPLGMVGLKRAAYLDHPESRVKDLADIAELAWGIVETGTHFEMTSVWDRVKEHPEAKIVRDTLIDLGEQTSISWDLDNARQELLKRNFSGSEIDEIIPERLSEWASYLK